MRVVELGDVNGGQGRPIPLGPWVACALGPDSLVDTLRVDGVTLGPGVVLPCSQTPSIEAVRGRRTGATTSAVVNRAQLMLYEPHDTVPGKVARAPYRCRDIQSTAAAAWSRRLRLPFAGRRYGTFTMKGTIAKAYQWAVVGIRYLPIGSASAAEPYTAELDTGTVTPQNSTYTGELLSAVKYAGGADSYEDFDELELWYTNLAADEFDVIGEAWD